MNKLKLMLFLAKYRKWIIPGVIIAIAAVVYFFFLR